MPLLGLNVCTNDAEVQEYKICFCGRNVCWGEQDVFRARLTKLVEIQLQAVIFFIVI